MKTAFVVNLDVPPGSDLNAVAQQIEEDLIDEGFQVLSVEPWARRNYAETLPPEVGQLPPLT